MSKHSYLYFRILLVVLVLSLFGYIFQASSWYRKLKIIPESSYAEYPRIFIDDLHSNITSSASSHVTLPPDLNDDLKVALAKAKEKVYKIVLWGPRNHSRPFYPIDFDECGACKVTYNKKEFDDVDSKALVVYFNRIHNPVEIPSKRRDDQLFVWWSLEAPPALAEPRRLNLLDLDGIFNLTMTYRRDSDIYDPYGMASWLLSDVIKSSNGGDPMKEVDKLISKKTGLVISIVSDCNYLRGAVTRLKYIHQLIAAGLKLEPHGKCFPNTQRVPDINVTQNFKFYLAFENSMYCRDYITEKFYVNSLLWGTVPIVLGSRKSDYLAVFPAGSFIFAEDFATPKSLVDYLNYLDKNVTAYKEYFKWRSMRVEDMPNYKRTTGFCHLCRVLHGINVDNVFNPRRKDLESFIPMFGFPNKSRTVNVRNWFYGNESRDCLPRY